MPKMLTELTKTEALSDSNLQDVREGRERQDVSSHASYRLALYTHSKAFSNVVYGSIPYPTAFSLRSLATAL